MRYIAGAQRRQPSGQGSQKPLRAPSRPGPSRRTTPPSRPGRRPRRPAQPTRRRTRRVPVPVGPAPSGPVILPPPRVPVRALSRILLRRFTLPWDLLASFWPRQPGQLGTGYDLAGAGWTQICSTGHDPLYEETLSYNWGSESDPSSNCGLGGQACSVCDPNNSNYPETPEPFHISVRVFEGPRIGSAVVRFRVREVWKRDGAALPLPNIGRAHRYAPLPIPAWPVDAPLPEPFRVPNGIPAPTPSPTPWRRVPRLPLFVAEPGGQWLQRGSGLKFRTPEIVKEFFSNAPRSRPRARPRPVARGEPRPRPVEEREHKTKFGSRAAIPILRAIGLSTEAFDMVGAIYRALPAAKRRQWRRELGFIGPAEKAYLIWTHYEEIDMDLAIKYLVREMMTDSIYARVSRRVGRHYGQTAQTPTGPQTGSWDDTISDAISDYVFEETGEYPKSLSDAFDAIDNLWRGIFAEAERFDRQRN